MASSITRRLLIVLACASGAASSFVPQPAQAQSADELAKARRLYRQGLSLEAGGDFAGALAKFEAVAKVRLTAQVRFHMARCKEELGRLNEALGDYRLAEYEAREAGAKELPEISAAKDKLEARVPKLVIQRGAGAEGARIELDGVELGEAKIGQEVAVDPGPHTLVVKLPGGARFEEQVEVTEGEVKSVELVPPEGLEAPEPDPTPTEEPDVVADPIEPPSGSALPWIVGGVGVVSLAASGVFFILKNGVESDMESTCRGSVCPRSIEDQQSKGESYALLTNVTLGVGLVGIGVATVLLLTGDSAAAPQQDARRSKPGRLKLDVGTTSAFSGFTLSGGF